MRRVYGCLFIVILCFGTYALNSAAQPCQVVVEEAAQLYGEGDEQGSAVYIALNHLTGFPAAVWMAEDQTIRLSRFNGSVWLPHEFVDTAGIAPVVEDVDGLHALPGLALAINSYGEHHILIADESYLYHFVETGGTWSSPEAVTEVLAPNPDDPHLIVRADFDGNDVLHVVYAIDGGGEASGKGLRYVKFDASGWSDPLWIASGPFMHMRVGQDGSVHVTYLQFHGMAGPDNTWRNYQGHYRQRTPDGTWLDEEQATDEEPVGTLGPVAIHPAVAADPLGGVHMIYPVDPPDPGSDPSSDRGHASYIERTDTGWSDPLVLFDNAIHAAFVDIMIDPAGVIYAVGINWEKRYRVDTGSGFEPVDFWYSRRDRWFNWDSVAGPSGGWLAYVSSRRAGPVEVVHFHRTGDCGVFCGDGVCGADEDDCSCLFDCTEGCCIDGNVYSSGDADPGDPCNVCRPGDNRRLWTFDSSAPGCTADEVEDDFTIDETPGETIEEDVSADFADDTAGVPDESTAEGAATTQGGCGCSLAG